MDEVGYQGWKNRDTWAMKLNLDNEYWLYNQVESVVHWAAIGNEESPEDFHAELAELLEQFVRGLIAGGSVSMLPDFDPGVHESPDPKDNHGPDDIEGVDWQEIAETYDLKDYV